MDSWSVSDNTCIHSKKSLKIRIQPHQQNNVSE